MYSPEYDDLEDFYPDNNIRTALLEYLCHAFSETPHG